MKRFLLALALAASFTVTAQAADYAIDGSHTQVQFTYNHFGMSNITGRFDYVKGTFDFDAANPTKSSIQVEIPVASLSTGVTKLDEHMKSPDFFDAAAFPTATFKSTKVTAAGDKKLTVAGDLTIHGVTKSVVVVWELTGVSQDPWGNTKIGFEGKAKISRKEFGLTWNAALETGGVLVGDEIKLELDVEAAKQA